MLIRLVTASLGILLMAALTHGCRLTDTTPRELIMEVPSPQTVLVGRNAVVRVTFRNVPEEGCVIDMTWYGFGGHGEPVQATVELFPSGASGDPARLQLVWESSNTVILGGQMEPPTVSISEGTELRRGTRDMGLALYFETLSAGTTDLTLTLTRTDGSIVRQTVVVNVTSEL
jgi:hypothetical protein